MSQKIIAGYLYFKEKNSVRCIFQPDGYEILVSILSVFLNVEPG